MPQSTTIPRTNWLYEFPPMLDAPPSRLVFESTNAQDAMGAFSLNWTAQAEPLFVRQPDGSFQSVPFSRAVRRSDDQRVICYTGRNTAITQHSVLFSELSQYLSPAEMLICDAGVIYGGKIAVLRATAFCSIPTRVAFYVSYDQSHGCGAMIYAHNNEFGVDIPIGSILFGRRATKPAEIPQQLMIYIRELVISTMHMFEVARASAHDLVVIQKYFKNVYGAKDGSTALKRVNEIYAHLQNYHPPSFWLALMSVAVYEEYKVYHSPQEQDRRTEQCLFGLGAKIKQRALRLAGINRYDQIR